MPPATSRMDPQKLSAQELAQLPFRSQDEALLKEFVHHFAQQIAVGSGIETSWIL
jgi:hypothetical protein